MATSIASIDSSYRRIRKVGGLLQGIFLIMSALSGIAALGIAVVLAGSYAISGPYLIDGFYPFVTLLVNLGVVSYVLHLGDRVASSIALGQSPFGERNSRRLSRGGVAMVVLAVFNKFWFGAYQQIMVLAEEGFDVEVAQSYSGDVGSLIALTFALFLLFMSAILRYGAVLQELSDETL